ncbi:hypothetical protein N7373_03455 [Achromobacter mucicolens]|uniref:hypothetical protein n=1 Tax=Achromobacter TaxID=222 RepID=UPI0024468FE6|nr:hypothetical protein [Achromobacter mucicolens]MDH0090493.1 hypothetical protein [Achromobacter mucicolens]
MINDVLHGIKTIQIRAKTNYPIVSAYEFEFLKSEAEIQALLKPCTIYFILQRPLLYFQNVRTNGELTFEITDYSSTEPLKCTFDPSVNGFGELGEELLIDVQFYKKDPDAQPPYNDVAALKIRKLDEHFLGWFSPAKFLYDYLSGRIQADVQGQIDAYLDYTVHYIGKSFSQDIWRRLTGHHKMQRILTLEEPMSSKSSRAPFEISLMMLDIDGFEERNLFPFFESALDLGIEPILHEFNADDDESFSNYYDPKLAPRAPELTSEVEGLLVSTFKPKYNEVLFDNYPNLSKGTRSAGYTKSSLLIERMPAILRTEHHTQELVLPDDV